MSVVSHKSNAKTASASPQRGGGRPYTHATSNNRGEVDLAGPEYKQRMKRLLWQTVPETCLEKNFDGTPNPEYHRFGPRITSQDARKIVTLSKRLMDSELSLAPPQHVPDAGEFGKRLGMLHCYAILEPPSTEPTRTKHDVGSPADAQRGMTMERRRKERWLRLQREKRTQLMKQEEDAKQTRKRGVAYNAGGVFALPSSKVLHDHKALKGKEARERQQREEEACAQREAELIAGPSNILASGVCHSHYMSPVRQRELIQQAIAEAMAEHELDEADEPDGAGGSTSAGVGGVGGGGGGPSGNSGSASPSVAGGESPPMPSSVNNGTNGSSTPAGGGRLLPPHRRHKPGGILQPPAGSTVANVSGFIYNPDAIDPHSGIVVPNNNSSAHPTNTSINTSNHAVNNRRRTTTPPPENASVFVSNAFLTPQAQKAKVRKENLETEAGVVFKMANAKHPLMFRHHTRSPIVAESVSRRMREEAERVMTAKANQQQQGGGGGGGGINSGLNSPFTSSEQQLATGPMMIGGGGGGRYERSPSLAISAGGGSSNGYHNQQVPVDPSDNPYGLAYDPMFRVVNERAARERRRRGLSTTSHSRSLQPSHSQQNMFASRDRNNCHSHHQHHYQHAHQQMFNQTVIVGLGEENKQQNVGVEEAQMGLSSIFHRNTNARANADNPNTTMEGGASPLVSPRPHTAANNTNATDTTAGENLVSPSLGASQTSLGNSNNKILGTSCVGAAAGGDGLQNSGVGSFRLGSSRSLLPRTGSNVVSGIDIDALGGSTHRLMKELAEGGGLASSLNGSFAQSLTASLSTIRKKPNRTSSDAGAAALSAILASKTGRSMKMSLTKSGAGRGSFGGLGPPVSSPSTGTTASPSIGPAIVTVDGRESPRGVLGDVGTDVSGNMYASFAHHRSGSSGDFSSPPSSGRPPHHPNTASHHHQQPPAAVCERPPSAISSSSSPRPPHDDDGGATRPAAAAPTNNNNTKAPNHLQMTDIEGCAEVSSLMTSPRRPQSGSIRRAGEEEERGDGEHHRVVDGDDGALARSRKVASSVVASSLHRSAGGVIAYESGINTPATARSRPQSALKRPNSAEARGVVGTVAFSLPPNATLISQQQQSGEPHHRGDTHSPHASPEPFAYHHHPDGASPAASAPLLLGGAATPIGGERSAHPHPHSHHQPPKGEVHGGAHLPDANADHYYIPPSLGGKPLPRPATMDQSYIVVSTAKRNPLLDKSTDEEGEEGDDDEEDELDGSVNTSSLNDGEGKKKKKGPATAPKRKMLHVPKQSRWMKQFDTALMLSEALQFVDRANRGHAPVARCTPNETLSKVGELSARAVIPALLQLTRPVQFAREKREMLELKHMAPLVGADGTDALRGGFLQKNPTSKSPARTTTRPPTAEGGTSPTASITTTATINIGHQHRVGSSLPSAQHQHNHYTSLTSTSAYRAPSITTVEEGDNPFLQSFTQPMPDRPQPTRARSPRPASPDLAANVVVVSEPSGARLTNGTAHTLSPSSSGGGVMRAGGRIIAGGSVTTREEALLSVVANNGGGPDAPHTVVQPLETTTENAVPPALVVPTPTDNAMGTTASSSAFEASGLVVVSPSKATATSSRPPSRALRAVIEEQRNARSPQSRHQQRPRVRSPGKFAPLSMPLQ